MYTWENELLSDEWTLTLDGVEVGKVVPQGASFACYLGSRLIAYRPDLASAQSAVVNTHSATLQGERLQG